MCTKGSQSNCRSLLILIVLLVTAGQISCSWHTVRRFEPDKEEKPIVLFDRYKLGFWSHAEGRHVFLCKVEFLSPLSYSSTIDLDSIPIFAIDSICFEGNCLESSICVKPTTLQDKFLSSYERSGEPVPKRSLPPDLWNRIDDEITPGEFKLDDAFRFPDSCYGRDVVVTVFARLTHRKTGEVIAKEVRRIQFIIKKVTRPEILSSLSTSSRKESSFRAEGHS